MITKSYKTHKVRPHENLFEVLDRYLPTLAEKNIVVITSKIISICQGQLVKTDDSVDKATLIKKESDHYFESEMLYRYGVLLLTLKNNILIANAGIDESNANGWYVLWPKDIQKTTQEIWEYLRKKHSVQSLGVIVTDSRLTPLRKGTLGVGIAWCGFNPLNNYIQTPDIFGRDLKMTQAGVIDGLAASAVLVMGEGKEQTPLAVISDLAFVQFQNRPPTKDELDELKIPLEDDIYAPLLTAVEWKPGSR